MRQIPLPSRKRLVVLAHILSRLNKEKVTSVELSALAGWGEATVRRDISLLELRNGVSNGYDVRLLHDAIFARLGIGGTAKRQCCVVGLSKLGEALLGGEAFAGTPFEIAAGFDTNVNRIEIMESRVPLFPTLDLEKKIRALNIEFALLAVPNDKAQFMAERLASYGIKGILNYTNVVLSLPKAVAVENMGAAMTLTDMAARIP